MKNIIFCTGNKNKINEMQSILGDEFKIEGKKIDIPEIQDVNVRTVVEKKLDYAIEKLQQPLIVEDTGLYIKNMNGFPGALVKFMLDKIKNNGISKLMGGSNATAVTVIGYYDGEKKHFFEGKKYGTISEKPKSMKKGFGWDPIFIPKIKDNNKTFSQMSIEEKNKISQRKACMS